MRTTNYVICKMATPFAQKGVAILQKGDTIRMKGCSLLQNWFILFYLNTSPSHPASFILQ